MNINWDELSPEEILAKGKELETESEKQSRGIAALERKRDELIIETKRQKKAFRLLQDRGIDPRADDYEDKLTELIAAIDEKKENPGKQQQQLDPANSDGTNNQQFLNPEVKAMLDRMSRQIDELRTENTAAKEREVQLQKEMEMNLIKATVVEKYRKLGVKSNLAEHLFALTKEKYKLDPDGKTVYSGDEYDMVPLETVVENLKSSDEFGDYFAGSGNSGSGMHNPSTTNIGTVNNPFVKGGNATEAAALVSSNPARAKILLAQAKASGKVDPVMARALEGVLSAS